MGMRGEWGTYRRGNGLYVGYVVVNDGGRRYVSSRDERAMHAKLLKLRNDLAAGVVVGMDATVADLMAKYAADRKLVLGAESRGYEGIALHRRYIEAHLGRVRLGSLTPGAVERMMVAIVRETGATYTPLKAREVLRAAWYWARRERMISGDNPAALAKPSVVDHVPKERKTLTIEDARRIREMDHPLRSLWCVALATGMRVSELCAVRWQDVDLDAGSVRVRGTKTVRSRGVVLLAPFAVEALKEYRKREMARGTLSEHVWHWYATGKPLDRWRVQRLWRRALEELGIPHVDFHHGTRHTLGDLLLADGVPLHVVQSVLRHALITTTRTIYAPAKVSEQASAAAAMQRLIGD